MDHSSCLHMYEEYEEYDNYFEQRSLRNPYQAAESQGGHEQSNQFRLRLTFNRPLFHCMYPFKSQKAGA